LYLRQNYHFGAYRIAAYLQCFNQIEIARSSVHRILVKHGTGRSPADQKHWPHRERWKRYEKAQPSLSELQLPDLRVYGQRFGVSDVPPE
jgi:hypothetical protein